MGRLYSLAEKVSQMATWASAGLLFFAATYITIDVLCRKLFSVSLHGSDEISGYVLAISTSWSLSFTLLKRANVRIDALYMRLSSRLTAWLDVVGLLLMGVFMAVVAWFSVSLWLNSVWMGATASTQLRTPLMIPQGLWAFGFVLFLVVLLVLLCKVGALLCKGDYEAVGRIAGIRSVAEEVSDEVSAETLQQLQQRGHHVN